MAVVDIWGLDMNVLALLRLVPYEYSFFNLLAVTLISYDIRPQSDLGAHFVDLL